MQPLHPIEKLIGPPPRWLWWKHEEFRRAIPEPEWAKHRDMHFWFTGYRRVIRTGRLTWARVVQANNGIFSHGGTDLPGEVVYPEDCRQEIDHDWFESVSKRLFALKGTQPSEPEEAAVAAHLTDEYTRAFAMKVPSSISGEIPCRLSTLMFHRAHLPDGKLSRSVFPVLVSAQGTGVVMVVPSKFWPAELREEWHQSGNIFGK